MSEFGEVTHNGMTLTLDRQAEFSNRVFFGGFAEPYSDGSYDAEFSAPAHDSKGNDYEVYWQFCVPAGEELPEDLGDLDWSDTHITQVRKQ